MFRKSFYTMIILHNHHVASKEASQVYNLYEDIHHHVLHSLKLNSTQLEARRVHKSIDGKKCQTFDEPQNWNLMLQCYHAMSWSELHDWIHHHKNRSSAACSMSKWVVHVVDLLKVNCQQNVMTAASHARHPPNNYSNISENLRSKILRKCVNHFGRKINSFLRPPLAIDFRRRAILQPSSFVLCSDIIIKVYVLTGAFKMRTSSEHRHKCFEKP